MSLSSDPSTIIPWIMTSLAAALVFIFGLFIKAQDRAYNEMKSSCDTRYQDMKAERDRVIVAQDVTNQNVVAVLGIIRIGVEGTGVSMQAQTVAMQAQTTAMVVLQRLMERFDADSHGRRSE